LVIPVKSVRNRSDSTRCVSEYDANAGYTRVVTYDPIHKMSVPGIIEDIADRNL
jgi:hypothetical protein